MRILGNEPTADVVEVRMGALSQNVRQKDRGQKYGIKASGGWAYRTQKTGFLLQSYCAP